MYGSRESRDGLSYASNSLGYGNVLDDQRSSTIRLRQSQEAIEGTRFHRGMRVWELDTNRARLMTWNRIQYAEERVDEVVLVENGLVVDDNGISMETEGI